MIDRRRVDRPLSDGTHGDIDTKRDANAQEGTVLRVPYMPSGWRLPQLGNRALSAAWFLAVLS